MKIGIRALALILLVGSVQGANWPAFRGANASGVAAGSAPLSWDREQGDHVAWEVSVPGLGHSSPIIWENRAFITTATPVDSGTTLELQTGDVDRAGIDSARDVVAHRWELLAFDLNDGSVVWRTLLYEGVPSVKRHVKASHASATPATNGRYIVALAGSEGLFGLDMSGKVLWKKDLGVMDVGLVGDTSYQWGPASSPLLFENLVIVQNDRHSDSYLAAFELATGREVWRHERDEWPSWATPSIVGNGESTQLVTNSPHFIRGYDPRDGRLLWKLEDPKGEVKVTTPVSGDGVVVVTGGYPPGGRPIYVISFGDKLADSEPGSGPGAPVLAWKADRGSPYTPTPIIHKGLLYVCTDNGILSSYDLGTGERIYRERISREAGGFSASPIIVGDHLYFTSEEGDVFVVAAGREFRLVAQSRMGEACLATPAFSGRTLLFRTRSRLVALR